MWRRLQGRREAVGVILVSGQGQGKSGGRRGCRRRRWVVGEVQGGRRGSVGLGAWGAAPATAVKIKTEREKKADKWLSQA